MICSLPLKFRQNYILRFFVIVIFFLVPSNISFSFPITVKDDSGYRFIAISKPKRIISTMPSNTEILFALGIGDRIVGVTDKCNYPSEVKKIKKIGGVNLNIEQILLLNPDLVVMLYDAQRVEAEQFRSYGLPVFAINPHTINQLMGSIRLIGKVTGTEQTAKKIVFDMAIKISKISSRHKKPPHPKMFVILWDNPLITAGEHTFIDDLIRLVGGINIGASAKGPYPLISFESVVAQDPDYIIISGKSSKDMDKILKSEKWNKVNAVKLKKVLLIDSDIITRPTPRLIHALDLISAFIYKSPHLSPEH